MRRGEVFPLDPINLPLRETPFETQSRYTCLGALFDAAPDAWGRTVMAQDEGIAATALAEETVLLKGRGNGVGAILFAPFLRGKADAGASPPVTYPHSHLPHKREIPRLYETVRAIETGAGVDERLRVLLMSSWDMGGARPKTVVRDDRGNEWIVKFPRKEDTYSHQRVEWANLEMARTIGMTVPEFSLHDLPGGDCALLVHRFDRLPGTMGNAGLLGVASRRRHFLSAVSLISPPADFDRRQLDTAYGASIFSYARIADVVRIVSSNVVHDLQDLFARMVLNILVRNTDDHLKNTGFLMDPKSPDFRYRLSPLYDVVTQEGALKHMLHIAPLSNANPDECQGRVGSLANARASALRWGLKPAVIDAIISQIQTVLSHRNDYYLKAGMSETEIAQVERWIHPEAAPVEQASPS
eukprot:scaffold31.g3786.t1